MSWPKVSELSADLTEHQRQELGCAFEARIGAFCGCPGAGKTFSTAAAIRQLIKEQGPGCVKICAPTGKAAIRATRSLRANGVNLRALTIHSMLGCSFGTSGMRFLHNESNPLPGKYFFVDESSWIGNYLGASLLSAIPRDGHVLFIGDHHQLPPVERGAMLRDLMSAGVPYGDLTEIHRNGGRIVQACKTIREGGFYEPSQSPAYGTLENLCHIESMTNADTLKKIDNLTSLIMRDLAGQINIKWDLQLLTYLNEGTPCSRKELNAFMQQRVNPDGQRIGDKYRMRDKIICLQNTSYEWESDGEKIRTFVANGQLAEIVNADDKRLCLKLESDGDSEECVYVTRKNLHEEWDLGYAISVHKSQGSSWPIVFLVIDDSARARFLGSRQIVYTGISRAEKYCVTIGKQSTVNRDLQRDSIHERRTKLADRLTERIYDGSGTPIWRI
ncbi:MAG: hypothetical protein E6R03_12055 [Hyphomicrobiaceae bacterium]|nr:MAG: hypothetical protein E6R03_12055 [Hyphomicrobiaceae bacterium]